MIRGTLTCDNNKYDTDKTSGNIEVTEGITICRELFMYHLLEGFEG